MIPQRDRLGERTIVHDPTSGLWAASLAELLRAAPHLRDGGLDPVGIDVALGKVRADDRTPLASVRAIPPSKVVPRDDVDVAAALVARCRRANVGDRRAAVTLGGGIDAPIAVLAARRAGITVRDAFHVAIPGTPYDERDAARAIASALDLDLNVIETTAETLARKMPMAVKLAGTPLYNLHPVSRLVVAEEARARGADILLSGDGADQAARGADEAPDYVPIVAAVTRGAGLDFLAPFTDDDVVDGIVGWRDPTKSRLRDLARAWGLPDAILARPKASSWAPPFPRSVFPAHLPWSEDDRENVGNASVAAFVAAYEVR